MSLDDLSRAGSAIDPADKAGQLTKAGRSLQKHGSQQGKRASSSRFPMAKGTPGDLNSKGQAVLDDILTTPGSTIVHRHHAKYGPIIEVRDPSGRGVRYDASGNFIGFLE
jgi:filamentous hemagglutinin